MIIDLGGGSHPRGDIVVDIQFERANPAPELLDPYLEEYGFKYNPNAKKIVWDLNKFPYPFEDNSADKILLSHVLEHLEAPVYVLRECKRILKEGGLLVIVVPNPFKNNADKIDKEHKYSWTVWSLRNLLEYVGFKVIEIKEIVEGLDIIAVVQK